MVTSINVPLVTKNALNGIIYRLKNRYKLDIILENIIVPSSSKDSRGTCKNLIYWNETKYGANDTPENPNPWFQISIPYGFIIPTAFSMRGTSGNFYFPSSWDVFGITECDENSWDLLATNNFRESTYCNGCYDSRCHDGTNIGTYLLKETKKKYQHLRWRLKTVFNNADDPYFPVSGFDVFGFLSFSKKMRMKITIVCGRLCVLSRFALPQCLKTE